MKITMTLQEVGVILQEHLDRFYPMSDYEVTEVDVDGYGHNQALAVTFKRKEGRSGEVDGEVQEGGADPEGARPAVSNRPT